MFEGFGEGLTLGLATGTACLASCGPVYAAYLMGEKREGLQSLWIILKLNAGRFFSYAIFGAVVGYVGGSVPVSVRVPLTHAGYVLFSLYLLLSVVRVKKTCSGCNTGKFLKITKSAFLLGIITGVSICPAFLIALTRAFDSNGPLNGMMMFIGFFAGTTVYMLPFALFGLLTMKDWITKAARVLAVIVAVYFAAVGVRGLIRWYSNPNAGVSDHMNAVESNSISEGDSTEVFSVEDADTLYLLTFEDDDSDMGRQLAQDMNSEMIPTIKVVPSSRTEWRDAVSSIPELSAVVAPGWVDTRFGAETAPWQDSLISSMEAARMRIFAVEYQPYCGDRASGVQSFLERYSFRCHPDSGFVFLMLNPLACSPAQCSTCDISH